MVAGALEQRASDSIGVPFSPTELAVRAPRVLSHGFLLQRVWGPERVGVSWALREVVKRLRHKLGDDAHRPAYLFTERRVGYHLAAPEAAGGGGGGRHGRPGRGPVSATATGAAPTTLPPTGSGVAPARVRERGAGDPPHRKGSGGSLSSQSR